MPVRDFKNIFPGEQLSSHDLSRLLEIAESLGRSTGDGPIGIAYGPTGLQVYDNRPPAIWGRITGLPEGNSYPWVQVLETEGDFPDYAQQFRAEGSASVMPAKEVNGNDGVPINAKVRLFPSPAGSFYIFDYGPPAGKPITSGTGSGTGGGGGSGTGGGDGHQQPCPVWYTGYLHMGSINVRLGERLNPQQLIGYIGTYRTGAHLHFSLGDGARLVDPGVTSFAGNTVDVFDWFPFPTFGDRNPEAEGPPYPYTDSFTQEQLDYIESTFAVPVTLDDWTIIKGSAFHKEYEYNAVDLSVIGEVVDGEIVPSQEVAGRPVYLACKSDEVNSVVVYADWLSDESHFGVVVRHTQGGCADDGGGTPSSGTGSGGDGGRDDDIPFDLGKWPKNRVVKVITGVCPVYPEIASGSSSSTGGGGSADPCDPANMCPTQPIDWKFSQSTLYLPLGSVIVREDCILGSDGNCDETCPPPGSGTGTGSGSSTGGGEPIPEDYCPTADSLDITFYVSGCDPLSEVLNFNGSAEWQNGGVAMGECLCGGMPDEGWLVNIQCISGVWNFTCSAPTGRTEDNIITVSPTFPLQITITGKMFCDRGSGQEEFDYTAIITDTGT